MEDEMRTTKTARDAKGAGRPGEVDAMTVEKHEGECGLCCYRGIRRKAVAPSTLYDCDICEECAEEEKTIARTSEAFHALASAMVRQ
jgi:hypothetical protein